MISARGSQTPSRVLLAMGIAIAMAVSCAAAAPSGIDALRWKRRVLLLTAPAADDPRLADQLRALADWRQGAENRDVTVIRVVGTAVEGVDGRADDLRRRYALPQGGFAAILIGKDGHVALRSREPLAGTDLARAIDAMPMRRAGQR